MLIPHSHNNTQPHNNTLLANPHDSRRVEFFNSESSFGSSSMMSSSRLDFMHEELLADIHQIFITLNQCLLPREDLTDLDQLRHLVHRANILSKDTLPDWTRYAKGADKHNDKHNDKDKGDEQINKLALELQKLVLNYEEYIGKRISYQQLYELYAHNNISTRARQLDFGKKSRAGGYDGNGMSKGQIRMDIQPDVVNIVENKINNKPRLKATLHNSSYHIGTVPNAHEANTGSGRPQQPHPDNSHRDISELQQEVVMLKRKQKLYQQQHDRMRLALMKQTHDRINNIINIFTQRNSNSTHAQSSALKEEITYYQKQLEQQSLKNKTQVEHIEHLVKRVEELEHRNRMITNELESMRRTTNSRVSAVDLDGNYKNKGGNSKNSDHENELDKSVMSEFDAAQSNEVRKLTKANKNLLYQNALLKAELNRERDILSTTIRQHHTQIDNQNTSLNKILEARARELTQCKMEIDRLKVENIGLRDKYERSVKCVELAKLEGEAKAKEMGRDRDLSGRSPSEYSMTNIAYSRTDPSKDRQRELSQKDKDRDYNRLQQSSVGVTKCSIHSYKGDGNEYTPYYELLNKQFKIRFKRACLRQKELLYKCNGLEIGSISQFVQPNEIRIHLHLSNFCTMNSISTLKLKVSNAYNNKVQIEKWAIDELRAGQQIKSVVSVMVKGYPIGCTALICEYQYAGKNEEVRVLLPVHVFKMLAVRVRDASFTSEAAKMHFEADRKIIKDWPTLCAYFSSNNNRAKGSEMSGDNTLKLSLLHEHTQTKVICDIEYQSEGNKIVVTYEHRSGDERICEYVMKTMGFLFRKEDATPLSLGISQC